MAAHVAASELPEAVRPPLTPLNGRRGGGGGARKQAAVSENVNPLALKADWDGEDDGAVATPVAAARGAAPGWDGDDATARKARRPSLGAAKKVSEMLGAARSGAAAATVASCFEFSDRAATTRCQISRKNGVYTLLTAQGTELLKATHSVVGKWTVVDAASGRYVGKAATSGVDGAVYKFKRADKACVGGMLLAPNSVHGSLPPEIRVAVPRARVAAKDVVAALRRRDYAACPTLLSKPVRWDGSGYVLDGFPDDLKIIPSAKNFQCVAHARDRADDDVPIALQLARVDRDTYCLEFAGPSPFVAFCAGLASIHSYNIYQ